MFSTFIIFWVQAYVCNSLTRSAAEDRLLAHTAAHHYLFTPRDYRMINDLAFANDNLVKSENYPKLLGSSKPQLKVRPKIWPQQQQQQQKQLQEQQQKQQWLTAAGSYPSTYLQPPAFNSASEYEKFFNYLRDTDDRVVVADGVPKNHRPDVVAKVQKIPKTTDGERPAYVRDHAPIQLAQSQSESESQAVSESKVNDVEKKSSKNKLPGSLKLSPDGDRVEFQIQGHEGPTTYIFGFDTGDGKNRQFRLEERSKDGTVKGHYGYYDARGKLRTIRYLARPFEGYREKHHVSNNISSEENNKL